MPPPVLVRYADWIRDTQLAVMGVNKPRSKELTDLDKAIQEYEKAPSVSGLKNVSTLLGAWKGGKASGTSRDYAKAVTQLEKALESAFKLFPPIPSRYGGIFIASNDVFRGDKFVRSEFLGVVTAALSQIASMPVGRSLLEGITARCPSPDAGKKVVIEYAAHFSSAAALDVLTDEVRLKLQQGMIGGFDSAAQMNNPNLTNGTGTTAVVMWNHLDVVRERPPYIGLAHELVHAYHYVSGRYLPGKDASGVPNEEKQTVGLGEHEGATPSENAIRGEHRIPPRTKY